MTWSPGPGNDQSGATPAGNGVSGSGTEADFIGKQTEANSVAGARQVPSRLIPVPEELDSGEAALIAGPFSPFWNLAPGDAATWKSIQQDRAAAIAPALAALRLHNGTGKLRRRERLSLVVEKAR